MTDRQNAALEEQVKELIIESLMLEDVMPAAIDADERLFGTGLGLDSIDALELAMAIHKRFGVRIAADDEQNRAIFRTVASLATFIAANQRPTEAAP